ncbi:DMT family transporter [Cytobacillus dafuensis]|uniref:DMT family transporter n=1 Tax=Cytobacillus dafuensis TaxID=1742359 RepID=UPI000710D88A|nr:DMT family transporter [Cytobacillus dafuensis]
MRGKRAANRYDITCFTHNIGLFHAGIGFYLFFLGMRKLKGQSIVILSYIDPLASLVISIMIIGEKMTDLQIIGAILLLGSTFMSEMHKTNTISFK